MTSYNLIAFTFLGKYVITLLDIVFLFAKAKNNILRIFSASFSVPLLLRYKSVPNPLQVRSIE